MCFCGPRKTRTPVIWSRTFLTLCLSYIGGMYASYQAMDYILFPSAVIIKSCKSMWLATLNSFFNGICYSLSDWTALLFVSIGTVTFWDGEWYSVSSASVLGLMWSVSSLFLDCVTGMFQVFTIIVFLLQFA